MCHVHYISAPACTRRRSRLVALLFVFLTCFLLRTSKNSTIVVQDALKTSQVVSGQSLQKHSGLNSVVVWRSEFDEFDSSGASCTSKHVLSRIKTRDIEVHVLKHPFQAALGGLSALRRSYSPLCESFGDNELALVCDLSKVRYHLKKRFLFVPNTGVLREPSLTVVRMVLGVWFGNESEKSVAQKDVYDALKSRDMVIARQLHSAALDILLRDLENLQIPIFAGDNETVDKTARHSMYMSTLSLSVDESPRIARIDPPINTGDSFTMNASRPSLQLVKYTTQVGVQRLADIRTRDILNCPLLQSKRTEKYKCTSDKARLREILRNMLYADDCRDRQPIVVHPLNAFRCLRSKSILFVGDSHERQHFIALSCALYAFEVQERRHVEFAHDSVFFPHKNLTLSYVGIQFPLATKNGVTGSSVVVKPYTLNRDLRDAVRANPDILVVGVGMHFHRVSLSDVNESSVYEPNSGTDTEIDSDLVSITYSQTQLLLENEITSHAVHRTGIVWRTPAVRHFVNGEWNTGGKCGPIENTNRALHVARCQRNAILDVVKMSRPWKVRTAVLDATDLSHPLWNFHVGLTSNNGFDCSHWCILGAPIMWASLLLRLLCKDDQFQFSHQGKNGVKRLCPLQDNDRIMFYHFRKAGGTSIKKVLQKHFESRKEIVSNAYGKSEVAGCASTFKIGIGHRADARCWNAEYVRKNESVVWIANIRNPVDWMTSYYEYSRRGKPDAYNNSLANMFHGKWAYKVLGKNWGLLCDGHWPCDLQSMRAKLQRHFLILDIDDSLSSCALLRKYFGHPQLELDCTKAGLPHENVGKDQHAAYPLATLSDIANSNKMAHIWEIYAVAQQRFAIDVLDL